MGYPKLIENDTPRYVISPEEAERHRLKQVLLQILMYEMAELGIYIVYPAAFEYLFH